MSSRWRSASTSETARVWGAFSLGALLLVSAALVACVRDGGPPRAALVPAPPEVPTGKVPRVKAPPPVRATPVFDHVAHLEKGLECTDCHAGAETEDEAGMPALETCMECHEEIDGEKPAERRVEAFLDPATKAPRWNRFTKQSDEIVFRHVRHANAKVACAECHGNVAESRQVGPQVFQTMDDCMACHEKRGANNACAACHTQISTERKPPSHTPDFVVRHGDVVRSGRAPAARLDDCALCHTQQSCADCHQERAPADHTPEWRRGPAHGQAAQQEPDRCATCHVAETCTSCHASTPPQDHQPKWREGPGHGQAAMHDRQRCAMCHEATTCLSCHRTEPPRDHTNHWRTGPGHGLAASLERERCAACHTTDQCVECHHNVAPRSHRAGWGSPRNRHCIGCHEGPGGLADSGCALCHHGTPSHRLAPDKPSWHRPDMECLQCHLRDMGHPVNDQNCNVCHR